MHATTVTSIHDTRVIFMVVSGGCCTDPDCCSLSTNHFASDCCSIQVHFTRMNIPEAPCLDIQRDQQPKVPPCFAPASMHVFHSLEAINTQKFFGSPAGAFKACMDLFAWEHAILHCIHWHTWHFVHACCRMPCRAHVQKQVRSGNAKFVARRLSSPCEEPSVEKINCTGELFPRGSLQRLQVRRLFSFVHDPICHGRFFTARLCKLVVRKLLREGRMSPAVDPSESMDAWVKKQAKRLQYICMRAKRSTCPLDPELEGTGLGTAMDNMETQAPACDLDALAAAWHACRIICL